MGSRCFSKLLFNIYRFKINNMLTNAKSSSSYTSKVALLSEVYDDMKSLSSCIRGNKELDDSYLSLRDKLLRKEGNFFSSEFICDSAPMFDPNDEKYVSGEAKKSFSVSEFLDLIVWLTRKSIFDQYSEYYDDLENLDSFSLSDECFRATFMAKFLCNGLNVNSREVKVSPGFTDREKLFDGHGYHYFLIVDLEDGEYIIDCTYRQFFRLDKNLFERMGVYGLSGCNAGYYMLLDEKRKSVADTILKRGWIKATPDNLKAYMDGFALSFRNGLFYESNGLIKLETPYTFYDYKRFLMGEDDQIKHEGYECLGVQESILKDKDYCKKLK